MDIRPNMTLSEYQTLRELIKRHPKEGLQLSAELDRAVIIEPEDLKNETIQIGSFIEFEVLKTNKKMNIQLVFPQDANLKEQKISILAPLGTALIGFSKNDEVEWDMPGGKMWLKITAVSN